MEYIPDGMSKAQWEAIKKKEQEALKGKNLGAVGITKFQSRSFEAWQKAGGKNLFPVDKNTPLTERPYMMRPGGRPDGSDLKQKGLTGRGQATAAPKTALDAKYEELEKKGELKSTPFSVPWTSKQATEVFSKKKDTTKATPTNSKSTVASKPEEPAKKKGFFGLF